MLEIIKIYSYHMTRKIFLQTSRISIIAVAVLCMAWQAKAQVQLANIFCDSMILQRGKPIHIWGTAAPGEKISIQFLKKTIKTKADGNGKWQVEFPSQKAGGPHMLQ